MCGDAHNLTTDELYPETVVFEVYMDSTLFGRHETFENVDPDVTVRLRCENGNCGTSFTVDNTGYCTDIDDPGGYYADDGTEEETPLETVVVDAVAAHMARNPQVRPELGQVGWEHQAFQDGEATGWYVYRRESSWKDVAWDFETLDLAARAVVTDMCSVSLFPKVEDEIDG